MKYEYVVFVTDIEGYKIVSFSLSGIVKVLASYENKADAQKHFKSFTLESVFLEDWVRHSIYDAIRGLAWPQAYIKQESF